MRVVRIANRWLLVVLILVCLWLITRVADRYPLQVDVSRQHIHSLSASAEQALTALSQPVVATVWLPNLTVERAQLEQLLAPYIAHSRGMQVEFIDPTRYPERARTAGVGRHGELHLAVGQRREVIARPTRAAIDAALNRLARQGERWIVALKGHGEATLDDESPGGLGRFATQIEALGYRVISVDPRQLDALPDNTALLLVGAPVQPYPSQVAHLISGYLGDGGAALWLTGAQGVAMDDREIRADTLPGFVVDAAAAQYGLDSPDNAVVSDYPAALANPPTGHSVIKQARALQWHASNAWQIVGRLRSSARSWNETGELSGRLRRDADQGEQAGPLDVGLLIEARKGGARLAIVGGRELLGNDQIGRADNLALATALINWLSGNAQLVAPDPTPDFEIHWSPELGSMLAIGLMAALPLAYLLVGLWLRARRRRA